VWRVEICPAGQSPQSSAIRAGTSAGDHRDSAVDAVLPGNLELGVALRTVPDSQILSALGAEIDGSTRRDWGATAGAAGDRGVGWPNVRFTATPLPRRVKLRRAGGTPGRKSQVRLRIQDFFNCRRIEPDCGRLVLLEDGQIGMSPTELLCQLSPGLGRGGAGQAGFPSVELQQCQLVVFAGLNAQGPPVGAIRNDPVPNFSEAEGST